MRNRNSVGRRAFAIFMLPVFIFCLTAGAFAAPTEVTVTDEPGFVNAITAQEAVIIVANDITLTRAYQLTHDLTIRSSGNATLSWGPTARGPMFTVVPGAHLTLESITLDGLGKRMTLVHVNGGSFTMNDGAVLKNLLSDGSSRAVTIGRTGAPTVGGTFNMNGGLITGVSLDAVVISYNGTINMGGSAAISDNTAYGIGMITSTLNMTGNATISNNTCNKPGVGVLAGTGSTINMGLADGDAPTISGNAATGTYSGAIYLVDSTMTMNFNASISGNSAETLAGAIGMNKSTLAMLGNSKINGNTASAGAGGGIFASQSTVELSESASIFDNAVSESGSGGGIYLQNAPSTLAVSGSASVYGNRAETGGGIYMSVGTQVQISGGVIRDNTAETDGGGIYVCGSLSVTGGSVEDNEAPNGNGGGIYTENITDYLNLSTDNKTLFSGNMASSAYTPPDNADVLYPQILFAASGIGEHPLNNYDINFSGTEILFFHVEYTANGGTGQDTGPDITPGYPDTILPLRATDIARPGYTFTGWNTQPDGSGLSYAPGETMTLTNNVTLYAQWSLNDFIWLAGLCLALAAIILIGCLMLNRR